MQSETHKLFEFLQQLLKDFGLEMSDKKLVPPSASVVYLDIQIDTVQITISIPHGQLQEILNVCKNCSNKTYFCKRDLQSFWSVSCILPIVLSQPGIFKIEC